MTEFRINANISDYGRILERVRKVGENMEAARGPATKAMAERVREKTIENLQTGKSGMIWRSPLIPRHWIQYSRSAGVSGGFPASQYGGLVGSIQVRQTAKGNATVEAGVGLSRPYAKYLELGFTTALAKRHVQFPFLRPSTEEVTPELSGIVAKIIKGMI